MFKIGEYRKGKKNEFSETFKVEFGCLSLDVIRSANSFDCAVGFKVKRGGLVVYKCFGCGGFFSSKDRPAICPVCRGRGVKVKEVSEVSEVSEKEAWDKVIKKAEQFIDKSRSCLLYTSPSPRDRQKSRMPSSA